MKKIIRITTVPGSLKVLLKGQLKFINKYYQVTAVSSPGVDLDSLTINEGVKTFGIKMTRKITPFEDLKSTFQIYTFLKKEKPLIVHTHTPKAGTAGMLAAKLANVPIRLHTVAGLPLMESSGFKRIILEFIEKITYLNATKIYPNSLGIYNYILENKLTTANKLKIIGNGSSNGIDTTYFNPELYSLQFKNDLKKDLNIKKNDFVFIFVGRLVKDKGINELIQAFVKVNSKFNSTKLILVGNKETKLDPLKKDTLKEINTNSNIIITGFQKDVRPYFAIADALTFPSYREGFPNVVLQASAMNLPCIVSDISGCNEIIKDKQNGFIIPPKNIEELENKMILLMKNVEIIEFMKQNSRSNIIKNYPQNLIWNSILSEYQDLEKTHLNSMN